MLLVDASSLLRVSDRELCVIMVQSQVHTAWRQVTIAIPKTSYYDIFTQKYTFCMLSVLIFIFFVLIHLTL